MKHFLLSVLLFAVGLVSTACSSVQPHDDDTIYVSILPLKGLLRELVGDDFPIKVLVPPGANPETFELSARQLSDLHRTDAIFNIGLIPFEQTLLADLGDRTVNLSAGIDLLEGSCREHEHHGAHGIDPHIWTSPRALKKMAQTAYDHIHKAHPDSMKYTANYRRLDQKIDELDAYVAEQIKASNTRYFIIYHPALTYYANDYGIEQTAIEADGKEPSAKHIARLIDCARKDGITRVLCQRQFPRTAVEIIARDIRAEVIMVDPLAEDVLLNIKQITDQITAQ